VSLNSILVPNVGCLFGVYPSSSCDAATSYATRVRNHETLINRTPTTNGVLNVISAYHDWNDYATAFPTSDEQTMATEGRLLLIHWTPRIFGSTTQYNWADIAAGAYDASIVIPQAKLMRDWGVTFFLAFHNEMNASSTAQGGTYGSDADYAAAAQHLHNVFVAQGATNVVWVFKPSGYTATISRMSTLYPGDSYVDWIGFDPYGSSSTSEDLDYVLLTKYPVINWATVTKSGSHTKPMMFGEWGKIETGGTYPNTKQGFYDQVRTTLQTTYPQIKAIVYFNGVAGSSECMNTSTSALTGYRALAAADYFNPDMSPTGPPVNTGAFQSSAATSFSNTASKQITIPADVQAGYGMALFHASTRTGFKNACEGTNAANVTTGNSGSAGSNPWDSLGAVTPVYSSTQAHAGTTSIHYTLTAQTAVRTTWEASFGAQVANQPYYGRLHYYRTALPPQITRLFQQNTAGATALHWGIGLDTAGKVVVRDIAGSSTKWTSSITPAANVWNRIEWKVTWNGSTQTVDVRIYENTGASETTLDDSGTSTAITQAAAGGQYSFGMQSPSQTYDIYLDDVGLDRNTWLGQAPHVSAVLTAPTGWTEIVPTGTPLVAAGAGELSTKAYRRTAVAGDPGSTVTLATDVNAHGAIVLLAYSGVDQLALVDVAAASTKNADSTTVVTPNVTTTGNNEWIVSVAFTRDNPGALTTSWTLPGGEAQRAAAFPSGTSDGRVATVASDDGVAHATGTYGSKTFTSNVNSYLGIGWTVAVKSTAAVSSGQSFGMMQTHN
jgi:Glycosyl hydrolase family 26